MLSHINLTLIKNRMPFINNLDDKLIHSLMKKEIENYEIETQVSNLKRFCIHSIFCIILIKIPFLIQTARNMLIMIL